MIWDLQTITFHRTSRYLGSSIGKTIILSIQNLIEKWLLHQSNRPLRNYLRPILIWCCGLLLANWFIVGAGPDCFVLLPIMLSRSIFNPEPAHVEPTSVEDIVLLDVWFLVLMDVGGRRFVTGDKPTDPKYDTNFSL